MEFSFKMNTNSKQFQSNTKENNGFEFDDDLDAEYFDDEPRRKPKQGKQLKKFKHPADR